MSMNQAKLRKYRGMFEEQSLEKLRQTHANEINHDIHLANTLF